MNRATYVKADTMRVILALLMPYNRLAMQIALSTGLRIDDVLSLPRDALLRQRVTIREKKTGKSRRITIPAAVREELLKLSAPGGQWAFPGRNPDRHRTRQAVWADVNRAAQALRLRGTVSPHSARKVFAVDELRRFDGDLERVQAVLGHKFAGTTAIYAFSDQIPAKKTGKRG